MATYTDLFDRPDDVLSDGPDWDVSPLRGSEILISNERAVHNQIAGGSVVWAGAGTWGRRQRSTIELASNYVSGDRVLVMAYMTEDAGYFLRITGAGTFDYGRMIPTTQTTQIGSQHALPDSATWQPGDTMGLEADDDGNGGTTLSSYHNGVQLPQVITILSTNPDLLTEGRPGFAMWANTVEIESWSGDDFDATEPAVPTPINLTTTDITTTSFRANWEMPS